MLNDLERLRADGTLRRLLSHYAERGEMDREAWQDRVMELDGIPCENLVKLHGELLAQEWIEPNVGVLPVPRAGTVPQCYRVTAAGLRALKRARHSEDDDGPQPQAA
jgi:hypothetical protein